MARTNCFLRSSLLDIVSFLDLNRKLFWFGQLTQGSIQILEFADVNSSTVPQRHTNDPSIALATPHPMICHERNTYENACEISDVGQTSQEFL
jgi:hypothetical protein